MKIDWVNKHEFVKENELMTITYWLGDEHHLYFRLKIKGRCFIDRKSIEAKCKNQKFGFEIIIDEVLKSQGIVCDRVGRWHGSWGYVDLH